MHTPLCRRGHFSFLLPRVAYKFPTSYRTASSPSLLQRHAHVLSWDLSVPVRTSSSVVQVTSCVVVIRCDLPLDCESRHLPEVGRNFQLFGFEDDDFKGTSNSESPHCLLLGSARRTFDGKRVSNIG
ncbi:hypothetical protein BDQ94DRAFT_186112 [Aspergillus welwitschiae]|uniref:Uncharacterized protein n=1 Tax=Aspergillus welwitschiae TaxID=1341132 RepID=A0A3F3PJB4_9EURO|nr:hypothetical protein BDQ94DRAFT_186112 [Aspergillus welwitschiae]RDH26832.1 hypothetical protein BDQ94DRAFT_186112 [Aspergillus welwitschiae]